MAYTIRFFMVVKFAERSYKLGYFWNLDPDPEKPETNIGLKNMSDFRELCFTNTIRHVSYCLKVRVLADI